MTINVRVFWVLCAFFAAATVEYTVWGLLDPFHYRVEWVGTIALGLCSALFALIAFYLARVRNSLEGRILPEDAADANVDDGDPEQGFFSPWSWWPVSLAFGAGLVFLGIAAGFWIAFIGAVLAVIALVGWIYEYYRGNFAH
ncbi:cytochrome c oxidase subunit 4 [Parafrigoribacterium soli]|uniref:cytochrome c oxidase subunit 4 n=1 Tax=Parafrigoribacterium soli TaxID=3144663 RepID=UPI0032EF1213